MSTYVPWALQHMQSPRKRAWSSISVTSTTWLLIYAATARRVGLRLSHTDALQLCNSWSVQSYGTQNVLLSLTGKVLLH